MRKFVIAALAVALFLPAVAQAQRSRVCFFWIRPREQVINTGSNNAMSKGEFVAELWKANVLMQILSKLDGLGNVQAKIMEQGGAIQSNQQMMMEMMLRQDQRQAALLQAIMDRSQRTRDFFAPILQRIAEKNGQTRPAPQQGAILDPGVEIVPIQGTRYTTRRSTVVSRMRNRISYLRRCCGNVARYKYYRAARNYIIRPRGAKTTQDDVIVKEYAFYIREILNGVPQGGYVHIGSIKITLQKEGPVNVQPVQAQSRAQTPSVGIQTAGGNNTLNVNVSGTIIVEHRGGIQTGCPCPCPKAQPVPAPKDDVKIQPTQPSGEVQPSTQPVSTGPPRGLQTYTTRYRGVAIFRRE